MCGFIIFGADPQEKNSVRLGKNQIDIKSEMETSFINCCPSGEINLIQFMVHFRHIGLR